jgi:2-polyprenyl-3-methyl-5-hydroxy-6-metoxy-1,4-benzoquinol methylase
MNSDLPLISCIMPTANRREFARQAIRYFLAQDYPAKELILVEDGTESAAGVMVADPSVRSFSLPGRPALGTKRNFACEQARGHFIVHWDDDDWSAPWRLRYQAEQILAANADISGLQRVTFYSPRERRAWEYVYPPGQRQWAYGASLCYRKAFWQAHPFPEIRSGEDTRFVWADKGARIQMLPDARFLVAIIHDRNTSPKRTNTPRYHPKPVTEVEQLFGEDLEFYRRFKGSGAQPLEVGALVCTPPPDADSAVEKPAALVTAALGIGDILRVTPLVRVLHQLGYAVDVLLQTDYPDTAKLIDGNPEVRRVFQLPSPRCGSGPVCLPELEARPYTVATFTTWSAPLRARVRSQRAFAFDRPFWLEAGDSSCVERIARELGWQGELPAPFACASDRHFDLPPGTIALHPGCKYEWHWKKWHGFDELARRFSSVAIIGSAEDVRTDNTYFRRPFAWPQLARDFTGQLSLPDTAALLRQCAALISNDSGLMHLGVALGVPTFGIFGITSPQREAIRSPRLFPITKGLPCEAHCRKGPWGRRDCDRHLECLKSLTPEEVLMKVSELLPKASAVPLRRLTSPPETGDKPRETINVAYYGCVFDASGYGHAARAYLHALHRVGVNLSVVDLAGGPPAVADSLVESMVGRKIEADFHLFHGIPPHWARQAFPLRNVIAMTVWETDTMPSQWRPALSHALEVWLPCEFNVTAFSRALHNPLFKLPHPLLPRPAATLTAPALLSGLGVNEHDFVFYSVFEWQDRKSPLETIEAFLRAFPSEQGTVLVLKTNPGAAQVGAAALADARKRTASKARVVLCCEGWPEDRITALHSRGDAYVSLHRGEGWNLPLFEAACLGKPIIATGFSGPLEYLDANAHFLVRHRSAQVRQRYAYYHPSMSWAEPEVAHAAELMRRVVTEREAAYARAAARAEVLRHDFSLEAVGSLAHQRMVQLLKKTNPEKWQRLHARVCQTCLKPPIPIPGEWYDADYFEHGLKSNWRGGYHWNSFSGLFRDTAAYITEMFPEAHSFLDAGCGKGFLVRALRERGKECWGIDHSRWVLDHAEALAKPYLWQAGVDNIDLEKPNDVLLVFSLLESLTEEQTLRFLERMRPLTRQALLVVIQTTENQPPDPPPASDHDLSHITLRPRSWWDELFLRAGWRRDALHRVAEQACRVHPLPRRMGWSVFVYSP